jgi:hypothetical protein
MRSLNLERWALGLAVLELVTLSTILHGQTPAEAPNALMTDLSATTISGYVDTSAVWNPGTGNANPAPYDFNPGKQDGFNLNSVDLKISKPQGETAWSAGYTAEFNWGPDSIGVDHGAAPIRQAFVALHVPVGNGIDLMLGRWDTLMGYESNDSISNRNVTWSYGYTVEPSSHTGLLAGYNFSEAINLQVGLSDALTTEDVGINTPVNVGTRRALTSQLTLTAPATWGFLKGSVLYFGYGVGPGLVGVDQNEWYVGGTFNTPIKRLTLGTCLDFIEHVSIGNEETGYFCSYSGYAAFNLTDKLTFNARAEYAEGLALGAMTTTTDFNKVIELTGTLQYDLWANVVLRFELRWDHAADGTTPFGGTVVGEPDKKNEVMLASSVIYRF